MSDKQTMTDVLTRHGEWRYTNGAGSPIVCRECGDVIETNVTAHQAAALSAAGFGSVRDAAAAGVLALENSWGSAGRVTIKSREAIEAARDMLGGEWDSLIKWEMDFHPRRIWSR